MTEERATYEVESKEIQVRDQLSPIEQMQIFVKSGGDLANLEKMLALQEKYDAIQAKKAFVMAMAKFKESPIVIMKDKDNKQYGSKYSSIGMTVNSCLPRMGACGLSHKWDFDPQTDVKFLTGRCIVTHCDGYSDSAEMTSPIDTSGSKNPIQQIKSTRTYIKIETFSSVMGLASSEDLDDDGNSASPQAAKKKIITIGKENVNWLMGFCKRHKILTPKEKEELQINYAFDPYGTTQEEFEKIVVSIKSDFGEKE